MNASNSNESNRSQYPLSSVSEHLNQISTQVNFPNLEQDVLEFWKQNNTFEKSLAKNDGGTDGSNEFVFYDGPPFANGLPHYGHLLTGYAKDVVPRYQTMKGKKVNRVFGWDCHGLPAELEAERELGIENKSEIDELGIDKFNDACRKSVLKYVDEWEKYVTRQARWVDFEHGYKTLDKDYMESIIWCFNELYKKDLVYEGFRVLPYCFKDQTPLSNSELRMDEDVYQPRQDQAVTVGVRLETGELALIWTTTPWTLPSNMLVAVGPDIEYVTIKVKTGDFAGESIILAQSRLSRYSREFGENEGEDFEIIARYPGDKLVGKKYHPIFPYQKTQAGKWEIVPADFVSTEEGTGLVHLAPYGEDDMEVIQGRKLELFLPVTPEAKFDNQVPEYQGENVFDANKKIITDFKNSTGAFASIDSKVRAILVRAESYEHSYPHCWRCRNPLIYKPVSSWFVDIQKIKSRMLETNQNINWVPENVKDGQFGKWLANARDWSISRNRYWGSPIPIWKSDDPNYPRIECYGSIKELEEAFGVEVKDLHRPYIDDLTRPNPDDPTGKSKMVRVTDVLDCWFESGSMSFAQKHYPFENEEWFKTHFPGDFVVEYIGQTRGWFYTLHILANAVFNCQAFENCMCHGIILGHDGQKMSKSLRNYPDVQEVFDRDGSDAMRWFLMASPVLNGGNLKVSEENIREATRQVLIPFWNAYYFFTLYCNVSNQQKGYIARILEPLEIDQLLDADKYILAKTRALIEAVTEKMDTFQIPDACQLLQEFLEILNNWYIRTNRERFWNEDENAFNTLYTCLKFFTQLIAPLLPMVSEVIYKSITGEESVHLSTWPDLKTNREANLVLLDNPTIIEIGDKVRGIVSGGYSLRKQNDLRVRLPLQKLTVLENEVSTLEKYQDLFIKELNLKEVELVNLASAKTLGYNIEQKLEINARALGPRIGKEVQNVIKNAKLGNWETKLNADNNEKVFVKTENGEVELEFGEYTLTESIKTENEVESGEVSASSQLFSQKLPSGGYIILDGTLTQELLDEGEIRDLIRDIQDVRKNSGLEVFDHIELSLGVDEANKSKVQRFEDLIKSETLAEKIIFNNSDTKIAVAKI